VQGQAQLAGLLTQGCLRLPALDWEKVVEPGPGVWPLQLPGQVGPMVPAPGAGNGQAQQAPAGKVVPVNTRSHGAKKRVQTRGNTAAPPHKAILPNPMVNGRAIPSLAIGREWPLWPLRSSPFYRSPLKKSVNAREHLEQGIALYDPQQHCSHAFLYGQDPGLACLSYAAWTLWLLGYPDQARQRSREMLSLIQGLSHPFRSGWRRE
jgi:hypothetical protein